MLRTVNIREIKNRLSAYLRDVQRGDTFLITDRGRVVAELRRPGGPVEARDAATEGALRLVQSGGLKLGLPNKPGVYRSTGVMLGADDIESAFEFVRGDR